MCLIAFAYKCHPKYSFILMANRDEFYQRPSDLLDYWPDNPDILAGRDREKSGTWLGLSKTGHFSAVTNYRDGNHIADGELRSRGELTRRFLCSNTSAQQYLNCLESEQTRFSDFNLLIGDQSGLYYFSNKANTAQQLNPGVYALSNALLDTPWPKLCYVKSKLAQLIKKDEMDIELLIAIMRDETKAATEQLPDTGVSLEWEKTLSSAFIKTDSYGTRATTILLQEKSGLTKIIEQSYGENGEMERRDFSLNIPPI